MMILSPLRGHPGGGSRVVPALTTAGLLLLAMTLASGRLQAQDQPSAGPQPQQKETNKRFQPSEAVFSTEVVPAEAQPGQTVQFRVQAKLAPTWHIFAYTAKQLDDGPRATEFDLFNPGGLTVAGEWTAEPPPTRSKDPNFPEVEFVEYHEDQVVWSIPLTIPADAQPGERSIQVQAYYQLCDPSTCSRPGRWNLEPASLTILAANTNAPDPAMPAAASDDPPAKPQEAATADASPPKQPRRPDDKPFFKPPQARLSTAVTPPNAAPGSTVNFEITMELDEGWHAYGLNNTEEADGPFTALDLFDTGGLTVAGEWKPDPQPEVKPDPQFPDLPFVATHDGKVTWRIPLTIPADAPPGARTLKVQAFYQLCDANQCTRPGRWTAPEAVLTVLPAGAAAPVMANPTPTTETTTNVAAAGVDTAKTTAASSPTEGAESAAEPVSSAAKPVTGRNEVTEAIERGIGPFMFLAIFGGLITLAMPCVWPMIPITVNFFVKQGEANRSRAVGLALTYSLSIIGMFTILGVAVAVLFGAKALQNIAINPWINGFIAVMFIAFGLSLLGLFELRLPNSLLNLSSQGEQAGGVIGVMFMALTLVITSFTCTAPVVGALLVAAAVGESYMYPILGMLIFSTVVALPFFALSIAPGLLKSLPKSGDWMNTVKVVGGLLELGAAFKFINNVELAFVPDPADAWFNAHVLIAIWSVTAAVCGLYLLGMFRSKYDYEQPIIGPGRLVFGTAFLTIALYLAPALFGAPPRSRAYEFFALGLLPPDYVNLERGGGFGGAATGDGEALAKKATSTDPDLAERVETIFHGVVWGLSYQAALDRARSDSKLVLIDFTGVWCANCRAMEGEVFPKPAVVEEMKKFVTVALYNDKVPIGSLTVEQQDILAERNFELMVNLIGSTTNPTYVVLDPRNEKVIDSIGGKRSVEDFVNFLKNARTKAETASPANDSRTVAR